MRLGLGVGANDVETVLRSLPSIALRYRAHDQAARTLARWCMQQPVFAQVLHPALPGSPGHAHWAALCGEGGAAGLFSVIVDPRFSTAQVHAFCDALKLFKIGYSWGGPISLVVPYDLAAMRTPWPPHLERGTLVRFSIGLEDVRDLQLDLSQAAQASLALTRCFPQWQRPAARLRYAVLTHLKPAHAPATCPFRRNARRPPRRGPLRAPAPRGAARAHGAAVAGRPVSLAGARYARPDGPHGHCRVLRHVLLGDGPDAGRGVPAPARIHHVHRLGLPAGGAVSGHGAVRGVAPPCSWACSPIWPAR